MKPRSHPGTVFSCCRLKKSSSPQNPAMPVRSGFGFQEHALEKKPPAKTALNPKMEPESGSGMPPPHTRSRRTPSANVGRFGTGDSHAHLRAANSRTKAVCEPAPSLAPSCAQVPGRFPWQRATPQPPPQHSCLQANPQATAKAPRPAPCASEAHHSASTSTCDRSLRASLDPNKIPAAPAWNATPDGAHHCPTSGCVGSNAPRSHSADNVAA